MTSQCRQLRRLAEKFLWIKPIRAPDAPGFHFFGGEVSGSEFGHHRTDLAPMSVSGKGFTRDDAFAGAVGEGVEYLSQLEWGSEGLVRGNPASVPHNHDMDEVDHLLQQLGIDSVQPTSALDWISGQRIVDRSDVLLPADLCLRRDPALHTREPPSALSTGCAAGSSRSEATLLALLEVVERDAAALWWLGGRRGRPVELGTLSRTSALQDLETLRAGTESRLTWLLDITTDTNIPCVAAISVNQQGRGFASGLCARLNLRDAIRGALLELCQIELGHHLVEAKRQVRGNDALNEADRIRRARSETFDAGECALLHPFGVPRAAEDPGWISTDEAIRLIIESLRSLSFSPLVVDMTRPQLGIPVARAFVPGLQPFPSTITTARLDRTRGTPAAGTIRPPGVSLL